MNRALFFLLVLTSADAFACDTFGKRNALSTQPLALFARGGSILYERYVAPPDVSVVGMIGARFPALQDYSSTTLTAGLEGRYWLLGQDRRRCAMEGPYLGVRVVFGWTTVTDEIADRQIGTSIGIDPTLWLGYRFAVADQLEVTPGIGVGTRVFIDPGGHLSATSRATVSLGLTVGWMF
jgi:hypothetical protein